MRNSKAIILSAVISLIQFRNIMGYTDMRRSNDLISDSKSDKQQLQKEEVVRFNILASQLSSQDSDNDTKQCIAAATCEPSQDIENREPLIRQKEEVPESIFQVENATFVVNNFEYIYDQDSIYEIQIDEEGGYEASIAVSVDGSNEFIHIFEGQHRTLYTFTREDSWLLHKSKGPGDFFRLIEWENVSEGPSHQSRPTLLMSIRTARVS